MREKVFLVYGLEDLTKTPEILAKPIMLTRKPELILTLMDQNATYNHKPSFWKTILSHYRTQ